VVYSHGAGCMPLLYAISRGESRVRGARRAVSSDRVGERFCRWIQKTQVVVVVVIVVVRAVEFWRP
jgi:hypothetical protein